MDTGIVNLASPLKPTVQIVNWLDKLDPNLQITRITRQVNILFCIRAEREAQDNKWGTEQPKDTKDFPAILMEEVGEIAKATLDHDVQNLKEELIQVAAVCVKWLERIYIDASN